jgi:SAM-dependent methyltransferase
MSTYTHGHPDAVLRSHRWRTVENSAAYLLPSLRPGLSILDVGCGPGTITADLAARVAPGGAVLGIDAGTDVIAQATRDHTASNLSFAVADLYALEGRYDVVHAHQVLQHVPDPVGALRAMARVTAPGGVLAARDADYESMTWFPSNPGLERWLDIYHTVARANGGEPDAGRRLVAWAHEAGLRDVVASASVWCFADPADRDWWGTTWATRITTSPLADRALELGVATRDELDACGDAWRAWVAHDDAWFAVVHGEVLIHL